MEKIFLPHITKNYSGLERYKMKFEIPTHRKFRKFDFPNGQNLSLYAQYHDPAIFYVYCHLPYFAATFAFAH